MEQNRIQKQKEGMWDAYESKKPSYPDDKDYMSGYYSVIRMNKK